MSKQGSVALVVLVLAAASVVVWMMSSPRTPAPPPVSLEGTYCVAIDSTPYRPRGPLPQDPVLAEWTQWVESATEQYLALVAYGAAHDRATPPPDARELACIRRLYGVVQTRMPEGSFLRVYAHEIVTRLLSYADAGADAPSAPAEGRKPTPDARIHRLTEQDTTDEQSCRSTRAFLAGMPENARLRRALLLHFTGCVEDNYSSVDGELDRYEPFLRATAEASPDRLGLDFELLTASASQLMDAERSTLRWLREPFGRITLDLGETGNALRVVRDLARGRPDVAPALLPTARRLAVLARLPPHRRARWVALRAYLEAGAPDPGEPMEPGLVRELESGDARRVQWALGFLPNELEEHAPRPYPFIRDKALIGALVRASSQERVLSEEENVLLLDALSRTPPGTAFAFLVRMTASPSESVWLAASQAIDRQLFQLEGASPVPVLSPHIEGLRAGLGRHVCTHVEALSLLIAANDKQLDAELASCLSSHAVLDTSFLQSLFGECVRHHDLGWARTAAALDALAKPGDSGEYARHVAHGCRIGAD